MKQIDYTQLGKFLSLVLRHKPETIGLTLDENGWADVTELLECLSRNGTAINKTHLDFLVANNDKKRYAYNDDQTKIRASQGHSISVDLGFEPQTPPLVLFHGTADRFSKSILENGLIRQSRQHVHLSKDRETALQVGTRHGKPIIFEVHSGAMHQDGYAFFLSENGVWLTDSVPPKYLRLME